MEKRFITTAFDFSGYRIEEHFGVVRGITVRSRSIVGNLMGGLQSLVGGNISVYTELCEDAREEAFQLLIRHAEDAGANAVIGLRYDANEIMEGITEVLCYGTAVKIVKE